MPCLIINMRKTSKELEMSLLHIRFGKFDLIFWFREGEVSCVHAGVFGIKGKSDFHKRG